MIQIIYCVPPAEQDSEIKWLHNQKVYPSISTVWDYIANQHSVAFGVIVNPEIALLIKLRHKLDVQTNYRQR